jgi:hypothetical protein
MLEIIFNILESIQISRWWLLIIALVTSAFAFYFKIKLVQLENKYKSLSQISTNVTQDQYQAFAKLTWYTRELSHNLSKTDLQPERKIIIETLYTELRQLVRKYILIFGPQTENKIYELTDYAKEIIENKNKYDALLHEKLELNILRLANSFLIKIPEIPKNQ